MHQHIRSHRAGAGGNWRKNGSASPLTGDCSTDAPLSIKPVLNGPISSHNTLNAAGAMRTIAYRDGREIASAASLSAVEIYFNDTMKPCSTCSANRFTSNACVSLFLAYPRLNTPTTDWLFNRVSLAEMPQYIYIYGRWRIPSG